MKQVNLEVLSGLTRLDYFFHVKSLKFLHITLLSNWDRTLAGASCMSFAGTHSGPNSNYILKKT